MRASFYVVAAMVLATSAGCGSTVEFEAKSPLQISAAAKTKAKPPKVEVKPQKAVLTATRIEINEKVQFELNSAVILPESHELLNQVAEIIKTHPALTIHVEGHASADGDDNINMRLSNARAESVRQFLITVGVDAARLTAKGYGETVPIADNNAEEGRIINRRVEFKVTRS